MSRRAVLFGLGGFGVMAALAVLGFAWRSKEAWFTESGDPLGAALAGALLATPSLACAVVLWLRGAMRWSMSALAFAFLCLTPAVALWGGRAWYRIEVNRSMHYCDSLVPALERVQRETGSYPQTLESIADGGRMPRLLMRQRDAGENEYVRLGDSFLFVVDGFEFNGIIRREWSGSYDYPRLFE